MLSFSRPDVQIFGLRPYETEKAAKNLRHEKLQLENIHHLPKDYWSIVIIGFYGKRDTQLILESLFLNEVNS